MRRSWPYMPLLSTERALSVVAVRAMRNEGFLVMLRFAPWALLTLRCEPWRSLLTFSPLEPLAILVCLSCVMRLRSIICIADGRVPGDVALAAAAAVALSASFSCCSCRCSAEGSGGTHVSRHVEALHTNRPAEARTKREKPADAHDHVHAVITPRKGSAHTHTRTCMIEESWSPTSWG